MKVIKIMCQGADAVDYHKILDFQGKLKDLSPEDAARLDKEMLDYGFNSPIHVWKKGKKLWNLDGHQRIKRVRFLVEEEGYKIGRIPIDYIKAKSMKDARHILLSRVSQYGKVNPRGLYDFLEDSQIHISEAVSAFQIPEIDMEQFQVKFFVDPEKQKEQEEKDNAVPNKAKSICKLGELWILGDHRLMCGDATNVDNVDKLMTGQKADMVFTDPPYGVSYQKKVESIANQSKSRKLSKILNDDIDPTQLYKDSFSLLKSIMNESCSFYITSPQGGPQMELMVAMDESGLRARHQLIWVKNAPVFSMGRLDYDYKHEPILYGWNKKHKHRGKGEFKNSIWEISREQNKLHPTMKPISLIENALLNSSDENNIVVDIFGGSGSTLIACEKTSRKCFMIEIDPHYCDVIIERWENYSGKKAKKEKR